MAITAPSDARPQEDGDGATTFDRLSWESLTSVPWLADFAEIPADSAAPLAMSPPHPDATGSLGPEFEKWLRVELGQELRWWQRLAAYKILETGPNGLVWQQIIASTPRRSGKSHLLRALALWRIHQADRFGEPQLVLHTAKDLAVCLEIMRRAFPWARSRDYLVRTKNGAEAIEILDTDSRWLVRGRDSIYGYDVTLGIVDEAHGVEPSVVDDGMEPALLDRIEPQLLLTSTAHRKATSLMTKRFHAAVAGLGDDTKTLLLWWGAGKDANIHDPAVWRAANPYWTAARESNIRDKYERAMRGELDESADDLDPMAGFAAQYLNTWPDPNEVRRSGVPLLTEAQFDETTVAVNGYPLQAVGIESWFASGASLAALYGPAGGPFVVSVRQHPNVTSAATEAEQLGAPVLAVGKSIVNDPAFASLSPTGVGGTSRALALEFRRLVDEDTLRHDGSDHLRGQATRLHVGDGSDGPRLVGGGRSDAVKAIMFAYQAAADRKPVPAIF